MAELWGRKICTVDVSEVGACSPFYLLGLWGRGRIIVVTGILRLGDVRHVPKLILVMSCFNKHRSSDLTVFVAEVSVTDMTLDSFPHDLPVTGAVSVYDFRTLIAGCSHNNQHPRIHLCLPC